MKLTYRALFCQFLKISVGIKLGCLSWLLLKLETIYLQAEIIVISPPISFCRNKSFL